MGNEAIIKVDNISKSFSSTKALTNVSLKIGKGEIRGLIGENGSGKSTLASIVAGVILPDCGDMYFEGEKYNPHNSVDAKETGIAMVLQEIGTIAGISVAANMFVGREKQFSSCGFLNYKKMYNLAKSELNRINAETIDPTANVDSLNLEERKIVEIAKATMDTTKLLVIDETSNALTKSGRDILYRVINDTKSRGGSVIFITHDLYELTDICDSVNYSAGWNIY